MRIVIADSLISMAFIVSMFTFVEFLFDIFKREIATPDIVSSSNSRISQSLNCIELNLAEVQLAL